VNGGEEEMGSSVECTGLPAGGDLLLEKDLPSLRVRGDPFDCSGVTQGRPVARARGDDFSVALLDERSELGPSVHLGDVAGRLGRSQVTSAQRPLHGVVATAIGVVQNRPE